MLTKEQQEIKKAINNGIYQGKLKSFARSLDNSLEELYDHYIRQKSLPTAEELVRGLE